MHFVDRTPNLTTTLSARRPFFCQTDPTASTDRPALARGKRPPPHATVMRPNFGLNERQSTLRSLRPITTWAASAPTVGAASANDWGRAGHYLFGAWCHASDHNRDREDGTATSTTFCRDNNISACDLYPIGFFRGQRYATPRRQLCPRVLFYRRRCGGNDLPQ